MHGLCTPAEHLSRRSLLKRAIVTSGGGVVMNWGGLTSVESIAAEARRQQKHCILLWMNGGASQFETFDMKPDRVTGGLFRPISTNVAGTHICELMPQMSQKMDKIAVIRSMRTSQVDHPGGIYLMHTGYAPSTTIRYPEIGAIVAKYQGREGADLPNFVKVSSQGDAGSGFLGPRYQAFQIGSRGELPAFSTSSMESSVELRRHELRSFVEDQFTQNRPSAPAQMHREAYEAARRLQNVRKVFDYESEWATQRELYGDSAFGRRCMLARRLVESGVPFIEVGQSSYDSHSDNFVAHQGLIPPMEHAWAGLLTDLERRGLLDKTLVVWTGEIGRTPKINNRAGRDHYVRCWSTALAGCGIKGGVVYGASDEEGVEVKDKPVTEGDFFATIYHALSLDPKAENLAGVRPVPLAPFHSQVVEELFA